jgi:1-acyl-sn-glycerol-3-phosphate acyltransferase
LSRGEAAPAGYRLVAALSRFLLRLFYERLDVIGAEDVPASAPLVVAANHHNSLVDAMLLVAVIPRRLRTLANAPLFRNPLIGPFLRAMGGLPVHRRQEGGNDPKRNAALFAETTATLRAGGSIMLFPEGRTQPEPRLLELRTGAARMLLAAEAPGPLPEPVVLLPVGLVFRDPGRFREGRALVRFGKPLDTADCVELARSEPEAAARRLTDRLGEAIRGLIIEAGDRETLGLLSFVEEIWTATTGGAPADERERVTWLQNTLRIYRALGERYPEKVRSIRDRLALFARELEVAGLEPAQLSNPGSRASVAHMASRHAAALLLATPLALIGIVIHILPYQLTGALVKRILRDEEEEATDKLAVGFVFFPILWLLEGVLVFRFAGIRAMVAFALGLFPLGFLALAWRERLERAIREGRAFLRERRQPGLLRGFRERRQSLVDELADLAKLVPEVS